MKLTNRHNLPAPIVEAVRRDPYSKGDAQFSATELIDAPRIHALRRRNAGQITEDVSEQVWSLLGRSVHGLLERYGRRAGLSDYVEQRYFADVAGWRFSGGMDLQVEEAGLKPRITILDWKLSTSKSAKGKIEWERQLNIYAYLYELTKGRQPDALSICLIIRDWKKEAAIQPDYPRAPIIQIPVKLWSSAEQKAYIEERIALHSAARAGDAFGDEPPECTDDERWKRGDSWALVREGGKRATAVYYDQAEAEGELKHAGEKYRLDHRPGKAIRCEDYCNVSRFCSQHQREANLKEPLS